MTIDPVELERLSDCTLDECPPGLFMFNGTMGFKSEYTTTLENPRRYQCDAYVVESGEYFHGGAKSTQDRAALIVTPLRTGQLVPAQPSGDVVEAVARALFVHEEGHPVGEATLNYWFSCDENSKGEDAHCKDTCDYLRGIARAAITAYEAVSGVAKMREALRPFAFIGEDDPKDTQAVWGMIYRDRVQDWFSYEDFEAARAALGEQP